MTTPVGPRAVDLRRLEAVADERLRGDDRRADAGNRAGLGQDDGPRAAVQASRSPSRPHQSDKAAHDERRQRTTTARGLRRTVCH